MRTIALKDFMAAREVWKRQVEAQKGPNDIVIDGDDEIICDYCNDDACPDLDVVHVIQGYVACPRCAKRKE